MKRKEFISIYILFYCKLINAQCGLFPIYFFQFQLPNCNNNNYVLVYEDDFNGDKLDLSKWRLKEDNQGAFIGYPIDPSYPGQKTEPQMEYNSLDNIEVSNGTLKIIAKNENVWRRAINWINDDNTILQDGLPNLRQYNYTSSSIWSNWKVRTFGKYEIRCRLPKGSGFWPAFWTYGKTYDGRWSELDVFEIYGHDINKFTCNSHFDIDNDGNSESCSFVKKNYKDFSEWHTFTAIFNFYYIWWLVDGEVVRVVPRMNTDSGDIIRCEDKPDLPEFERYWLKNYYPDADHQIIMNLAIERRNPPNGSTVFPNYMEIDYVRYYMKKDCSNDLFIANTGQLNLDDDRKVENTICGNSIILNNIELKVTDWNSYTREHLQVLAKKRVIIKKDTKIRGGQLRVRIDNSIYKPDIDNDSENFTNNFERNTILEKKGIIYPNPASSEVFLTKEANPEWNFLSISDFNGRIIYERKITLEVEKIDVSNYQPGIYIISILNNSHLKIKQFKLVVIK